MVQAFGKMPLSTYPSTYQRKTARNASVSDVQIIIHANKKRHVKLTASPMYGSQSGGIGKKKNDI